MDTQHPNNSSQNKAFFSQLEDFFDTYLHKKVPIHLPAQIKEFIVKFCPWLIILGLLLALPAAAVTISALGSQISRVRPWRANQSRASAITTPLKAKPASTMEITQ